MVSLTPWPFYTRQRSSGIHSLGGGGLFQDKNLLIPPKLGARIVHPVDSDMKRVNACMMFTVVAMSKNKTRSLYSGGGQGPSERSAYEAEAVFGVNVQHGVRH